jgi:hypothetical protein
MALIYQATLTPSKLELLTGWLAGRSWAGDVSDLRQVGAYRFDDPAGEVGMETFLLQAPDGRVLHVPVTYRAGPSDAPAEHLLGTTEHSVLGTRWVYDGCADPVWAAAVTGVVLTGGTQVEEIVDDAGRRTPRRPSATVTGSGAPGTPVPAVGVPHPHDVDATTVVSTDAVEIVVVRVVGAAEPTGATLTGSWSGGGPAVLAGVNPL